ncbi:hypothetical protein KAH81_09295 [bacterium]|nr:hypothetical protein [bacterium]
MASHQRLGTDCRRKSPGGRVLLNKIKGETYLTRADFEIFLSQDSVYSLFVEADDNILPMIKDEVRDYQLVV